jgi:hypothetical protein
MPIKLDWIDHNASVETHNIYRSLNKIDQGNLGVPVATVAGNVTTWTDNTVQRGVTYHYVVTSVQGVDEAPSAEFVIAYIPYTGPGPQTLARGNWEYGYFGRVPLEDIFSAVEFLQATGMTSLSTVNAATGNYWHKIVYKGKILFYPNVHVASALSWLSLYQAGLVYGLTPVADWPAQIKTLYGTPAQGKTISQSVHQFVVRLATSRVSFATTGTTQVDLRGGEVDKVLAACYIAREFNDFAIPAFEDSLSALSAGLHRLTADWHSASSVVSRTANTIPNSIDGFPTTPPTATSATSTLWCPILELVT